MDDFYFAREGGDIHLDGYNIYRKGIKLNESLLTVKEFTDKNPVQGENTYTVTAVYKERISNYSESVVLNTVNIESNEYSYQVYGGIGEIIVRGAAQEQVAVTGTDGIVYCRKTSTEDDLIPVSAGIYIVKVSNKVFKVIVR